jgi:ferredoxin
MDEIINRAGELLESGTVQLVIGYEEGTGNKTRAAFITNAADTRRLIFDSRCIQNLAVYLYKAEIKKLGRPAVIASVPVMRSIIQLASENQISDDSIIVLGVTPDMKMIEFKDLGETEAFISQYNIETAERDREIIEKLDSMTPSERWNYWISALEPCFKCYACRAACPLCYCTKCTVEINQPQWVAVASHTAGNLEWHIMRAMHLAGRCTDCDACAEACPVGVPLNILNKKIREEMTADFGGYGPSLKKGGMMSTFRPDDKEHFIN